MCNFGILLAWTTEEGLSLFKEEVVEYFSLFFLLFFFFFRAPPFAKKKRKKGSRKALCFRVFSVYKIPLPV